MAIASTACLPQTCSCSSQALNCGVSDGVGDVAMNLTLLSGRGPNRSGASGLTQNSSALRSQSDRSVVHVHVAVALDNLSAT